MGRFYATTPIYYVTDAPHIGHAYTTVTTDALCRWRRLLGDEVFFLTGTDEHGLKVARAAADAGHSPREHADLMSARYRDAWDHLDISYDDFIRTTEPRHYAAVQEFLQKIYDNGDIELGVYEGPYCVSCEGYYAESDLVGPNDDLCPIHNKPVEELREENWFFKLSRYEQRLLDWYAANPEVVQPETKRNEAIGLIKTGLRDVSITRTSLDWGVPVPWAPGHVFYVWYDALINYVTAIDYRTSDAGRFEAWWPKAHHLLAKDILRFHTVYWPAMCMAAGIDPPHRLYVHGYLLVGGEKMSKTTLNMIAPADLTPEFGVDGFRYHLLRDTNFGSDGDFSHEGMVARYNADLANNLGNLVSRVATVVGKACGGIGPAPSPDSPLATVATDVLAAATDAWERVRPNEALEASWRLVRETNAYLEANEPWKAEAGPAVDRVMGDALEALRIVTILASPAMPTICREIWRRLGLAGAPEQQRLPEAASWGGYPGGLTVEKGDPLFPRKK
ncbi:MAG TPA: methionine--tRNA ligase [Acidimicrobiales bacterium]|nr:methionine--tRNA ligase [Acidimicrobiales bacterium]